MRRLTPFSLLFALVVVGCKSPDDDLAPAFVPKTYAFEGKVDAKLVGTWVSTDGVSTLDLGKDGALRIQTLTPTPSGKSKSNVEGKWLTSGGGLLMQYGASEGGNTVLRYTATHTGDTLVLQQEGGRTKTTYKRK